MLKKIMPLLIGAFLSNYGSAQILKYKEVKNDDLVYVLNNIEKHIQFKNSTQDLFVNVYVVDDPSGSAGFENDEITNSIYIATSEDGEAPIRNLYKLTSVYDPKVIRWTKDTKELKLIFSYGIYGKRKTATIQINLNRLVINYIK